MQFIQIILYTLYICVMGDKNFNESAREMKKAVNLPPCASCRVLIETFKKGIDRTARSKFDGGDAAWEEAKMGSYKKSEVRLVEVQERLCDEVERGQNQCLKAAEVNEGLLESWWFEKQETDSDVHAWLCIEELKVCCPNGHYGPDCLPCKGDAEDPCGGNGKCKGNGTRKGNGDCECNKGYEGEMCHYCNEGFYESYKDETKLLCDPCHRACSGHCTGGGQKYCTACQSGWIMSSERGCLDRDECYLDNPCKENQYCLNKEGSYKCNKCHAACEGCKGDGADMCIKCAEDYVEEFGLCVDTAPMKREKTMTFARYVTYTGMTVATCIILQKHTTIAAFVGLSVAIYISFSEYYLTNIDTERKGAVQSNLKFES